MRKLIADNLVSLDGYYEGRGRSVDALFEHFHEDYAGDDRFDRYATERLRAAGTLILSGRTSFLDWKGYWSSLPDDPNATQIRREYAALINIDPIEKVVVSDSITEQDLARWESTTRIVRRGEPPCRDRGPQRASRPGDRADGRPRPVERPDRP